MKERLDTHRPSHGRSWELPRDNPAVLDSCPQQYKDGLGPVIAVPASPGRSENVISFERWSLGHVFSRSGLWFYRRARFNPSFLMEQWEVRCACGRKTDWLCVFFGWPRGRHRLNWNDCVPWLECPARLGAPHGTINAEDIHDILVHLAPIEGKVASKDEDQRGERFSRAANG